MYDVISVSNYVNMVNDQLEHHNISDHLQLLLQSIDAHGFTATSAKQLESIDKQIKRTTRAQCTKQKLLKTPSTFKYTKAAKIKLKRSVYCNV